MTVNPKKYLQTLQELTRLWKDLKLVYAADDEGNHFQEVHYPPTIGHLRGTTFKRFITRPPLGISTAKTSIK
jgi:hypothetical protein